MRWRQRHRAERLRCVAIDHELEVVVVVGKIHKIGFEKDRVKLPGQNSGIFSTYPVTSREKLAQAQLCLLLDTGTIYQHRYWGSK